MGTQTVRECLEFSASLRLPRTVSAATRAAFVCEILDELELTAIAERQVGDSNIPGLSPSEMKRVTIGVELAANPPILFLSPLRTHDARHARRHHLRVGLISSVRLPPLCSCSAGMSRPPVSTVALLSSSCALFEPSPLADEQSFAPVSLSHPL